jgi:hypothetical protein
MDGNSACSSKKDSDYSTVARLQKINITEGCLPTIFYLGTVQYCVYVCVRWTNYTDIHHRRLHLARLQKINITEGYDILSYCTVLCMYVYRWTNYTDIHHRRLHLARLQKINITEGYDILSYCTVLCMYVYRWTNYTDIHHRRLHFWSTFGWYLIAIANDYWIWMRYCKLALFIYILSNLTIILLRFYSRCCLPYFIFPSHFSILLIASF